MACTIDNVVLKCTYMLWPSDAHKLACAASYCRLLTSFIAPHADDAMAAARERPLTVRLLDNHRC